MASFKPIKQSRVSQEVLAQLKEAILRRQFRYGDKLPSERELTEQFQVSRGVVREAIRALEITGFVDIRQGPSGGAFVRELSFDSLKGGLLDLYLVNKLSIQELNQVRLHIEPEVARLAALNMDPADKERLQEAAREEHLPIRDNTERMERLTQVHFLLAECCGNYLFEAIVRSIVGLTHQIVDTADPADHGAVHGIGEHDRIVQAVLANDPEAAAQAMRQHLKKFCAGLIKMDRAYRRLIKSGQASLA